MSNRLFKRGASVTIARAAPNAFFTAEANALVIAELRIAFKVEKHVGKEPNTCEITISNLAESTRAAVQSLPLIVELDAGYDGNLRRVFSGDLIYAFSERKGADWETVLHVGDGTRAFGDARVSRSYPVGVDALTMVKEAAGKMGLSVPSNLAGLLPELGNRAASSVTVEGPAQRELSRVLDRLGIDWSVQDGRLQLLRTDAATENEAIVISQDTGMVGSPAFGSPTNDGKPPVLKSKSLLYPEVAAGGKIAVTSRSINGVFRVEKLSHTGDTRGKDWYTETESRAVA